MTNAPRTCRRGRPVDDDAVTDRGQTIAGVLLASGVGAGAAPGRARAARRVLRHRGLLRLPRHGQRPARRPRLPAARRQDGDVVGPRRDASRMDTSARSVVGRRCRSRRPRRRAPPPAPAAPRSRCSTPRTSSAVSTGGTCRPRGRRPRGLAAPRLALRSARARRDDAATAITGRVRRASTRAARLGDRPRRPASRLHVLVGPADGAGSAPLTAPAGRAGARDRRARPHAAVPRLGPARRLHRRCRAGARQGRAGRRRSAGGRGRRRTVPAAGRRVPDRRPAPRARGLRGQPGRRLASGWLPRPWQLLGGPGKAGELPVTSAPPPPPDPVPRRSRRGRRARHRPGRARDHRPRRRRLVADPRHRAHGRSGRRVRQPRVHPAARTARRGRLRADRRRRFVEVDAEQRTRVPGVFAAGEITGIGGVDAALAEGAIAGHAAAGGLPG